MNISRWNQTLRAFMCVAWEFITTIWNFQPAWWCVPFICFSERFRQDLSVHQTLWSM